MSQIERPSIRSKTLIRGMMPLCAALAFGLGAVAAGAQVQQGLAAAYPGDLGLAADPRVVFFEDFETGTVGNLGTRWDQVVTGGGMTLPNDAPTDSHGVRSVQMSAQGAGSEGGQLYSLLPAGLETVYVRHYVKYRSGAAFEGHTGVWLGGYNPATSYPQGGAGIRPLGNDRFFLTFQPFGTSRMDFYAYWMGMSGLPNGYFWGNSFIQDPGLQPDYDDWMCIEVMLKGNKPVTTANGELKLWINGVPTIHLGPGYPNGYDSYGVFTPDPDGPPWRGFQWRNTTALQPNFVWLSMYEPYLPQGTTARVLFDQVVVATQYIGPIARDVPEPAVGTALLVGSLWLGSIARGRAGLPPMPARTPPSA